MPLDSNKLSLLIIDVQRDMKELGSKLTASLPLYIAKNMNETERPGSERRSSKSNPDGYVWVGGKNSTSKLYVNSGVLLQSFIKGRKGFNSDVSVTQTNVVFQVGSLIPYAFVHEFGNSAMNLKKRPYMNPALEEMDKEIIEDFKKELVNKIQKAFT